MHKFQMFIQYKLFERKEVFPTFQNKGDVWSRYFALEIILIAFFCCSNRGASVVLIAEPHIYIYAVRNRWVNERIRAFKFTKFFILFILKRDFEIFLHNWLMCESKLKYSSKYTPRLLKVFSLPALCTRSMGDTKSGSVGRPISVELYTSWHSFHWSAYHEF